MSVANWYCHKCETFGGGLPNEMTMQEHIDFAHKGGVVRIESTPL